MEKSSRDNPTVSIAVINITEQRHFLIYSRNNEDSYILKLVLTKIIKTNMTTSQE